MGETLNRVPLSKLESTADALSICATKLIDAIKIMQANQLESIPLTWTDNTENCVRLVKRLGPKALLEAEEEAWSKKHGEESHFDKAKKKSTSEAARREKKKAPKKGKS